MLPLAGHTSSKTGYAWSKLSDGLEYARLSMSNEQGESKKFTIIHAFKIDPQKFKIDVITSAPKEQWGESIKRMAKRNGALIATNGGFFTPEHKSIGLLIKSGKQINPHHNTSWWSVFGIKDNQPKIIPSWSAKKLQGYQMAIQAGPRLVINGQIPKLKKSESASRTAIGITRKDKVILLATEGAGISMHELAEKMKAKRLQGGLECFNAMGLDGGSSTQLFANVGKLKLSVSSFSPIPNGIGVFKK